MKHILSEYKRPLKYVFCVIAISELMSIYVYNFKFTESYFEPFRISMTLFNIGLIVIFPFWLAFDTFKKKPKGSRLSGWWLGLSTSIILNILFLLFGIFDFALKINFLDLSLNNTKPYFLTGSVIGIIAILIIGAIAGWLAQVVARSR